MGNLVYEGLVEKVAAHGRGLKISGYDQWFNTDKNSPIALRPFEGKTVSMVAKEVTTAKGTSHVITSVQPVTEKASEEAAPVEEDKKASNASEPKKAPPPAARFYESEAHYIARQKQIARSTSLAQAIAFYGDEVTSVMEAQDVLEVAEVFYQYLTKDAV